MSTETTGPTLQELLAKVLGEIGSAYRFRWYGAAVAWLTFLLGWGAVTLLPNAYQANARVFVDSSSVLRPVLNTQIVPVDIATQLSFVRQSLLGRPHLERVARANELDVLARTEADIEQVITGLRESIQITSRDNTNTVYTISYRHSDRDTAIGVVATLLNSLVEDTIDAGQEGSDTASRFLDERIGDYEQRLQQAEEALAQFKRRNSDRLPSTQGGYFEMLRRARDSLSDAERERRLAASRQEQIRAQLQSESPVMPSGSGPPADLDPNSLDARIRDYRARLDGLLLEYTDRHPDVVNAREALTRLEEQRAAQLRALGVLDPDQELAGLGSNPVYQSLRIALNEADVIIAAIDADIAERRAEVNRLQLLIDEVPEVEAELARLNRDYNVIYEQYQALVRSRETQDLSRKARSADDVQFRVIDPPLAALQPVSPNRLLMLGAALCGALAAGAGLCWLLAQLRPVFTSAGELATVTSFPVLGTVSRALPRWQRRRRVLAHVAFSGVIGALAVVWAAAVLVELAGPGMRAMVGLA